ncbi:hypothetical protein LEP1GSC075_3099 [Leptospira interrogans str. Kito]|uniref:Uncharacterized protein n=1 Tax=Leptospira interrogans str. UI 12621 TaxID=1049937 RepID=A0A0F6HAW5_LEPIR|nr:hypothetical protein LEP1GSC080_3166 [Leptospira interrogans str. FPW2026]EKO25423.1 hypothetical protein LEP1GSC104_3589 [Leptospira interrogans str. UI 12621]EKO70188.1 hypothetical protein LEP1GSC069_2849 [Leptospira interrogans serovar Canicola str. Fiocruz LV133]EKR80570.1 hypothetical protein LEP1GSC099_2587 [Leptospira interrogans str. UI 08452]EMK19940.1 hypothetical protein LEP1GSC075_3099 [Leptospira interrogans str. Kito]EMN41594.1 hypothetical protein LEP1GSC085_0959 [Leptospira
MKLCAVANEKFIKLRKSLLPIFFFNVSRVVREIGEFFLKV